MATEEGFEGWSTDLPNPIDYEDFIRVNRPIMIGRRLMKTALGLCYTSGTTGNPMGVEYEHRSQYLHTLTCAMTDSMALSGTDSVCGIVPMFHAMGWGIPWLR